MRSKQNHLLAYSYCSLVAITVICGFILSRIPQSAFADVNDTATATVTVASACTLTTSGGGTYSITMSNGASSAVNANAISIACNDNGGFAIYVVGYSKNVIGNNNLLYSGTGNGYDISTATNSHGSSWGMSLAASNVTLHNNFGSARNIPSSHTLAASSNSSTSNASITPTYNITVGGSQPAGTYVGKVKYTIVHPSNAAAPTQTGMGLYDTIADMSKGTQTFNDLTANITADNSGVYEYNSSAFGTASDASNDYVIYYYRGILDSDLDGTSSTYGSNGNGALWPNYVKLGNTCWRIVRTTGSGGVKMIYNGLYGATTSGSCANSQTNAQVQTSAFNTSRSARNTFIYAIGYNFFSGPFPVDATYSEVFVNGFNDSTIKSAVEVWFSSNISAYVGILEDSAGYCNDRTLYVNSGRDVVRVGDNDIIDGIAPTSTGTYTEYYFGPGYRNGATLLSGSPSLNCARNSDLLTTSNATNGNKMLSQPVSLLTVDEAILSGSGSVLSSGGGGMSLLGRYHYNSFLRSGSGFWLLSPRHRSNNGQVSAYRIGAEGSSANGALTDSTSYGVRPVISLKPGTTATTGSGIATDPWVVPAPQ